MNIGKGTKKAELTDEQLESLKTFGEGGFLNKSIQDEARLKQNFASTPLDTDFFNSLMQPIADTPVAPTQSLDKKPMNPVVAEYLTKKIQDRKPQATVDSTAAEDFIVETPKTPSFLDQYSEEERKKALDASREHNTGLAVAQLFGGIGDAIAGRSSADTAKRFSDYRAQIKDNTIGEFDRSQKAAIENYNTKRQVEQNQMTDAQRARDMDVNSEESKMARTLAVKMGMNPEVAKTLTAAKFRETSPVLEKMYAIEQAKLARQDAAALRAESKANREFEKSQILETTYGTARTADDAKQLKGAAETKTKFDRQLQELINLRKDKGVEYMDRESVARAKQLSRDLLLGYKDLAKLGVLSQSDEAILNDIIPNDPLGQDWAPGQDPTLYKLEKFQTDVNSDFDARLDQRLRNPDNQARRSKDSSFPRQVRKGNQVATVSNAAELKEAQDEGFN